MAMVDMFLHIFQDFQVHRRGRWGQSEFPCKIFVLALQAVVADSLQFPVGICGSGHGSEIFELRLAQRLGGDWPKGTPERVY